MFLTSLSLLCVCNKLLFKQILLKDLRTFFFFFFFFFRSYQLIIIIVFVCLFVLLFGCDYYFIGRVYFWLGGVLVSFMVFNQTCLNNFVGIPLYIVPLSLPTCNSTGGCLKECYPVGWGCRIHRLLLCREVRPLSSTSVLDMILNSLMVRF